MASLSGLRGTGYKQLNWLLLVEFVIAVVLVTFYLFYLNRLAGVVLGWALNRTIGRRNNARFLFEGVQISPLGGRIAWKDARYQSRNQSLRVLEGNITYRWWLRRTRQDQDSRPDAQKLPCRLAIRLEGVEWFLYNRTPSFDDILAQLASQTTSAAPSVVDKEPSRPQSFTAHMHNDSAGEPADSSGDIDWLRELLPAEVRAFNGSIVLGNASTPTVLICAFDAVAGTYETVKSRSKHDRYKSVFHFLFEKAKIIFRTNPDYEEPLLERGQRAADLLVVQNALPKSTFDHMSSTFQALRQGDFAKRFKLYSLQTLDAPFAHPDMAAWKGLERYRTEDTTGAHAAEYAKVTTLLDTPALDLTYYADVPGRVPDQISQRAHGLLDSYDIGNGDLAPEWGVDIQIRGGVVNYGPWLDRQRGDLMKTFTPAVFLDAVETPRLLPGQTRLHTALKIFAEFTSATKFRVPTREQSKDWKYDGMTNDTDSMIGLGPRPYGWFDISVGANSTLSFVLPMIASASGYDTVMEVHLDEFSVSSSVNYVTFLKASLCRVSLQMPAPLKWDSLHHWVITTSLTSGEIYLLRDHTYLIADLVKDWTAAPAAPFTNFVPFLYSIDLTLVDFKQYLYLNDHNIINNPLQISDNTLLLIDVPRLTAHIEVPSDVYNASENLVTFEADAANVDCKLSLPEWNTYAAFAESVPVHFGSVAHLHLHGKYTYHAQVEVGQVESLDLDAKLVDMRFKALGYVLRTLVNLRDCYFGVFTHFATLEEYRSRLSRDVQGDPLERKWRPGFNEIFDVNLCLEIQDAAMVLPEDHYRCNDGVALLVPDVQLQLRNHDSFMELAVNAEHYQLELWTACQNLATWHTKAKDRLLAGAGFEVAGHRMFGPQPRTSTYAGHWDVNVGSIDSWLTFKDIMMLTSVSAAVGFSITDADNALPPDFALDSDADATFASVNIESLAGTIFSDCRTSALHASLPLGVQVQSSTLISMDALSTVQIEVPSITLVTLLQEKGQDCFTQTAQLLSSLHIDVVKRRSDLEDAFQKQRAFIMGQDALSHRFKPLVMPHRGRDTHMSGLFLPALGRTSEVKKDRNVSRTTGREEVYGGSEQDEFADYEAETTTATASHRQSYERPTFLRLTQHRSSSSYDHETRRRDEALDFWQNPQQWFLRDGHWQTSASPTGILKPPDVLDSNAKVQRPWPTVEHGEEMTCVRVTSMGGLLVRATPQVAANLVAFCSSRSHTSAESALDSLQRAFMATYHADVPAFHSRTILRIDEVDINIRSCQDTLQEADVSALAESRTRYKSNGRGVASCASLTVDQMSLEMDISANTRVQDEDTPHQRLYSDLSRIGCNVAANDIALRLSLTEPDAYDGLTGAGRPSTLPRTRTGTVLDLSLAPVDLRISLAMDKSSVRAHFDGIEMIFVESAAELIAGATCAWLQVARQIGESSVDAEIGLPKPASRSMRHLVISALQSAAKDGLDTEPAFLNRASYLVHGGRRSPRGDFSWKLLAHIRHCARHAGCRDLRGASLETYDLQDAVALLKEWRSWEIDESELWDLALLRMLFAADDASPDILWQQLVSLTSAVSADLQVGPITAKLAEARFGNAANFITLRPLKGLLRSEGLYESGELRPWASITWDGAHVVTHPAVFGLIRHALRVRRVFEHRVQASKPAPAIDTRRTRQIWQRPKISSALVLTILASCKTIDVSIASELSVSLVIADLYATSQVRREPDSELSGSTQILVGLLELTASDNSGKPSSLMSVTLNRFETSAAWLSGASAASSLCSSSATSVLLTPTLHAVSRLASLSARFPQSVSRMHTLADSWRQDIVKHSAVYLDKLRQDWQAVDEALHRSAGPTPSLGTASNRQAIRVAIQVSLANTSVQMHALQKLSIEYALRDCSLGFESIIGAGSSQSFQGSVEVSGHSLVLRDSVKSGSLRRIALSAVRVVYDRRADCALVKLLVDRFTATLSVQLLDYALTLYQAIEAEYDDLEPIIKRYTARQPASKTIQVASASSSTVNPSISASLLFSGFQIAVQSPKAVQYFESGRVVADISKPSDSQSILWHAALDDLVISLDQPHGRTSYQRKVSSRHRLAYLMLSVSASNQKVNLPEIVEDKDASHLSHLHLKISHLHAVMQAIAIEALGSLIDYHIIEIKARRSQRAKELEAIKAKLLDAFDSNTSSSAAEVPWVTRCVLSLSVNELGIAIPLEDFGTEKNDHVAVAAFLFACKSLTFATQKGSAGFVSITGLSAQFVDHFRQARRDHFAARESRNKMLMPALTVIVSPHDEEALHTTSVSSEVSGLEIDMDPSILRRFVALRRVYQLSNDRYNRLETRPSVQTSSSLASDVDSLPESHVEASSRQHLFKGACHFKSGVVRLHAYSATRSSSIVNGSSLERTASLTETRAEVPPRDARGAGRADVFVLPGVSGTVIHRKLPQSTDATAPSELHVAFVIHSSTNVLYPTLLPFMRHALAQVDTGEAASTNQTQAQSHEEETEGVADFEPPAILGGLRTSISIRIDISKLDISCGAAAPVAVSLSWQSGGFLVTLAPHAKRVSLCVNLDEIAVDLRHSFSPEKCIGAKVKDLALSMTLNVSEVAGEPHILAVACDIARVASELNARQLQDWICMKTVWIDELSELTQSSTYDDPVADVEAGHRNCGGSKLAVTGLCRIRSLTFVAQLGQAIGTVTCEVQAPSIKFSKSPHGLHRSALSFDGITVSSKGRLSGSLTVGPSALISVLKMPISNTKLVDTDHLLSVALKLGEAECQLDFDWRRIALFHADPIMVRVQDDLSNVSNAAVPSRSNVKLIFTVRLGVCNVIATVRTIPLLAQIGVDLQRLAHDRTLKAMQIMQRAMPSPSKPPTQQQLSHAVPSGQHVDHASSTTLSLTFKSERLRIAIFPRTFADNDVYRADTGLVSAALIRCYTSNGQLERDLTVHLGFLSMRRLRPKKILPSEERELHISAWIQAFREATDRNIFKIPTTDVSMRSLQEPGTRVVEHWFKLVYDGQVDIALNYALLKSLGELFQSFQQALARVGSGTITDRGKPDEPLPVTVEPLTLIARENVINQPKLNLLGDATPPLEWLGVQRSKFPQWCHEGMTIPLEGLLLVLQSNLYHKRLPAELQ
ncbi:uncharacterized protein L969DRAFT_25347 [Mixia osmundae IAM 14324]|uniref:Uncharacterized protein n=1 Tax=Mixia osmundae (strain CBS 9802 / IAM 14324 / JCM 22182 / KY 12970) TaxID=764103 RepID=G7DWV9_MIXOS|nr:uncharacterized protein L969DRAFT_20524 [Mixia osmundae IAM 14324]XP_014566422.1 uncharacterized protein L969DRAFT_25347 [Mixia osmundae IAM 14324]KEI36167.1 hypothetical protein L969DRAFT_20524 [Mixia osmundae IAM 14324]KEI38135.1 hypothetical protein L969DRAFT_25347 [Mixia osmundae IAM 14324]GAA95056.1 hypothetical protein E5Q_01712 [Mixia osmundae IAM 14324]